MLRELHFCETNKTRLLATKVRVTPSSSKESKLLALTPRKELHGMVYLARLVDTLLTCIPFQPTYIFLATNRKCTISAYEVKDKVLQS